MVGEILRKTIITMPLLLEINTPSMRQFSFITHLFLIVSPIYNLEALSFAHLNTAPGTWEAEAKSL